MKFVCEKDKCTLCRACVDCCPKNAITVEDNLSCLNAVIDESRCVDCGMCHRVCQVNHPPEVSAPVKWYQGWANDPKIREKSASGGFASAITKAFIQNGGVAASCLFREGQFVIDMAEDEKTAELFAGSKYVKSNPEGVYCRIREALSSGKKVLFIGLPCQAAALKKFIGDRNSENLYIVDLICHGSPSPKMLEIFLKQYGVEMNEVFAMNFRADNFFSISANDKLLEMSGVCDRYTIAFLEGISYTQNCYSCNYAKLERVSDMTLGDSWGSELNDDEVKRGISLALCQNEKGKELLDMADLTLLPVDLKKAIANNQQLKKPSVKPAKYDAFFEKIREGKDFNRLVLTHAPKKSIKQLVKKVMKKSHIIK